MGACAIPPPAAGLTADTVSSYFDIAGWERAVSDAYAIGRRRSTQDRIVERLSGFHLRRVPFGVTVSKEAVGMFVEDELDSLLEEPQNAEFVSDSAGGVAIASEIPREWISPEEVSDKIVRSLGFLEDSEIDFEVRRQSPDIVAPDLEKYLPLSRAVSEKSRVEFHYGSLVASLPGRTLSTWLTVDPSSRALTIKKRPLEIFLRQRVGAAIDEPPINSRFEMRGGRLVETVRGRAGNSVDIDAIVDDILQALSRTSEVPELIPITITIVRTEPAVTRETISAFEIRELVGTAVTNFTGGSLDRRHNIKTGAEKLHGILIAPGEEFSTLRILGEVSEEEGFREELIIKGDKTVREVGGGLCQIATTLFRAVLNAGLPVTERRNHSFVVGYYGAGLDATIYSPHPDLRFVNDTGEYLLLQGRVHEDEVIFEFYGTKDGRVATVSKPVISNPVSPPPPLHTYTDSLPAGEVKCTERARDGMHAEATYSVTYPNGEVVEHVFKSDYRPWQEVCLIGTGGAPVSIPQ